MSKESISIYCSWCHRYTSLSPALGVVLPDIGNQEVLAVWRKDLKDIWWIGVCNSCHNAVLVHQFSDKGGAWRREIFPHPLPSPTDERIPEKIRKDMDEAKLCFSVNAFRACAVMARRAIQAACIDKGANENKHLVD